VGALDRAEQSRAGLEVAHSFDPRSLATTVAVLMLLAVPFIFLNNALLAGLYSRGRERRIAVMTAPVGVVGLAAVVGGQLMLGAEGATAGFVGRQVLYTAALLGMLRLGRRVLA